MRLQFNHCHCGTQLAKCYLRKLTLTAAIGATAFKSKPSSCSVNVIHPSIIHLTSCDVKEFCRQRCAPRNDWRRRRFVYIQAENIPQPFRRCYFGIEVFLRACYKYNYGYSMTTQSEFDVSDFPLWTRRSARAQQCYTQNVSYLYIC